MIRKQSIVKIQDTEPQHDLAQWCNGYKQSVVNSRFIVPKGSISRTDNDLEHIDHIDRLQQNLDPKAAVTRFCSGHVYCMWNTDPTPQACARSRVDRTAPTREHEL